MDSEGRINGLARDKDPVLDLGQDWDNNTVQLPSVTVEGKELWMYYSGHDGSSFRLGRAVAPVPWFTWPLVERSGIRSLRTAFLTLEERTACL